MNGLIGGGYITNVIELFGRSDPGKVNKITVLDGDTVEACCDNSERGVMYLYGNI